MEEDRKKENQEMRGETISEYFQIFFAICILIGIYALNRKVQTWSAKRAYFSIINDLKRQRAFGASSAINLSDARMGIIRLGMKNYRSNAMEYLVASDVVGVTDKGKYYLKDPKHLISE